MNLLLTGQNLHLFLAFLGEYRQVWFSLSFYILQWTSNSASLNLWILEVFMVYENLQLLDAFLFACFSEFKCSVVWQINLKSSWQNHTLLNFHSYSNLFLVFFSMLFDLFILFLFFQFIKVSNITCNLQIRITRDMVEWIISFIALKFRSMRTECRNKWRTVT